MSERQSSLDGFGVATDAPVHEPDTTRYKIPTSDLIDELLRVADEVGGAPTKTDMDEHGEYSAKTYHNRFGSWNAALTEAGLEPNVELNTNTDRDAMIDELLRVADEVGGTPTMTDMNEIGAYSAKTYQRRLGSWNATLTEAGLQPNKEMNIDRDAMVDELLRVAKVVGGPPTRADMDEIGAYHAETYHNHFGSWTKALYTAGFDVTAYVYVAYPALPDSGVVKIGMSGNLDERMTSLCAQLRIAVEHPYALDVEHNLHDEFSDRYIRNEQFALDFDESEALVERIRGWARTFGTDVIEPDEFATDGGADGE